MKKIIRHIHLLLLSIGLFTSLAAFKEKGTGPWKEKQLLKAEVLAERIKTGDTANLLILNTGPVEDIKGAITFGAVENPDNLEKLKVYLNEVPKDKEIVIYCGCCPLAVCPNLKPAYDALKDMKFQNYKVLRLVQDLQEDWIDKGYPVK